MEAAREWESFGDVGAFLLVGDMARPFNAPPEPLRLIFFESEILEDRREREGMDTLDFSLFGMKSSSGIEMGPGVSFEDQNTYR